MSHRLQQIAAKDTYLLDFSSPAEKTMYNSLGILVVIISALALFTISYSLYLVYFANGFRGSTKDYINVFFILSLSFVWTLIVFNFYRFSLSAVSTHKYEFDLTQLPRLIIQLFFGIIIGLSISLPLAVIVSHEEFRIDLTRSQEKMLITLEESIDIPFEEQLLTYYQDLTLALEKIDASSKNAEKYQKTPNVPKDKLDALKSEQQTDLDAAQKIQDQISAIRQEIYEKKKQAQSDIRTNDGLITNLEKALEKNRRIVILFSIFICLILVFPSLFQALYIPGIYDYLVEYTNHLSLTKFGILPESKKIFIGNEHVHIPYYTFPEELMRQQKLDIESLAEIDRQIILKKEKSKTI